MSAPSRSTPHLSGAAPPKAAGPSRRTRFYLDRLSVSLFLIVFAAALFHWPNSAGLRSNLAAGLLGLPIGVVVADAVAGLAHWFADRFFAPTTPGIGPWLIAPFREHHVDPGSIGRHDFFEVSGSNALTCIPLAAALFLLPGAEGFGSALLGLAAIASVAALFATNQFHGWAHAASPPRFARLLQRAGLVLTPEAHARHHRGEHDRAYCVTSGWLNPLLDRVHFFERLETCFGRSRKSDA